MTAVGGGPGLPQDRRLDRRRFLERMTALTAVASAGGLAAPEALGAEGGPGAGGGRRGPSGVAAPEGALPPHGPAPSPAAGLRLPRVAVPQVADPAELTVAEAATLLRDGALDPLELVEACLRRIEEREELYQAYNTVVAGQALEAARGLRAAPWRGPLHGIPLALKDNYYTQGIPTTANSLIFADFVPGWDATAWARLREGGAVLLGKTQMGPLATTAASTPEGIRTTRNAWVPHEASVSPGGSSSGSATAVAGGLALAATGTQTGGSITSPANAQGLTGIKPTMGRVSLHGIIPLTYTRDHPGPLARDAMDAALLLQAMAGPDEDDPRTLGLPPVPDLVRAATPWTEGGRVRLRWPTIVGIFPGYLDAPGEPDPDPQETDDPDRARRIRERHARREVEAAARRRFVATLEELGARVVEVEPPEAWDTLTSWSFNNVRLPERTEPFLPWLRKDVRLFGVSLSPWINGLLLSGPEYLRGQRAKLLLLRRILDDVFARCDVVLQEGPIPFDMVGLPLAAFPVGTSGGGDGSPERPLGVILGGQPFAEDRLLSVAAGWQAVTDWHRLRPPVPAPAEAGGPGPDRREARRIGVEEVMERGE